MGLGNSMILILIMIIKTANSLKNKSRRNRQVFLIKETHVLSIHFFKYFFYDTGFRFTNIVRREPELLYIQLSIESIIWINADAGTSKLFTE